jgi:hypothetical protein
MKIQVKGYIAGFISAVILLSSINVYADGLNQTLDVMVNKINIAINGTIVGKAGAYYTLDNGENVPYSILYNGTTYLPMRKVAELVGKNVQWENNTNTASINDTSVYNNGNTNVSTAVSNELRFFSKEYKSIYVKLNEDGLYTLSNLEVSNIGKLNEKYYLSWSNALSVLNIIEGDYVVGNTANPYILGQLIIQNPSYEVKIEQKFSDINTNFSDCTIYKISDISNSYYFTTKEDSSEGLYLNKDGRILISIDDLLSFFGYSDKCKIDFDEVNKNIILNITD